MPHPLRSHYANDWLITRKKLANCSAVIGVGLEAYRFKSPSLHYGATFYVPKASIGASLGVELPSILSAIGAALGHVDFMRGGNDDWEIQRRFSLTNLDGGYVGIGSIGAAVGPIEGHGTSLKIRDNCAREVASYNEGSFGAGNGASINLGRVAIGPLYGPFDEG